MRLFILADSCFDIPSLIIHRKILDIVLAGQSSAQLHFYIVGDHVPAELEETLLSNEQVSVLKTRPAERLVSEVTNAMVLHFGMRLKGSASLPQYFIPLTYPNIDHTHSIWHRWKMQYLFNQFIKKAAGVFMKNEWAGQFFDQHYKKGAVDFQNAILPLAVPPSFEWINLSETKSVLTQGSNYFLFFSHPDDFVATLKEFSQFKKWQQTTMAMVFIFDSTKQCDIASELLKGYKYKESIYIQCIDEVKLEWIAATYAILCSRMNFNKTSWIQWAIHYDIPLMFDQNCQLPESWINAGEIFSFSDAMALSNHFKLYYKDEVYRQARANMGKEWLHNLELIAPPSDYVHIPNDLKP
ncbi:MAG: hypothetical protein WCP61_01720 [Chitinophagia bacterium]|jgi:hypothetical protein